MSVRSTEFSTLMDEVSSISSEESIYLTLVPPRVTLSRAPAELQRQNTHKDKARESKGRTDIWRITLRRLNDVENLIDITGIDVNADDIQ
jgi:hypothetical protein